MSIVETIASVPVEHEKNIFGQFDQYTKKIERAFHVTIVSRDGELRIVGAQRAASRAKGVILQLLELSKRGNVIQEQNVDYAISLAMEDDSSSLVELDGDCICHTINGKPIKPKPWDSSAMWRPCAVI